MPFPQPRPAILASILSVVVALSMFAVALAESPANPSSPAAQPSSPATKYDRIALTALEYEGRAEGQCWTFVQRVVHEATGKKIGFDYRQGFFEAGAVEVGVKDAKSGDIIQLARDDNTAPDADYPGLHTAIILENNGDGSFKVVDSNAHWDEVVRVRERYAPAEMAARYAGLNFHIYRIMYDGQDVPPPPPARVALKEHAPLQAGDVAFVAADGDCLNLRTAPGGDIITCIPDRTKLTVAAEGITSGGRVWVPVTVEGFIGWVALDYLTFPIAPAAGDGEVADAGEPEA